MGPKRGAREHGEPVAQPAEREGSIAPQLPAPPLGNACQGVGMGPSASAPLTGKEPWGLQAASHQEGT